MARFSGTVGFLQTVETDPENHPSVYTEVLTERQYYGDVLMHSRRWDQNGNLNENLAISNVEVQYPRLILSLGGQYHEPEKS